MIMLLVTSCSKDSIRGSGNTLTETRSVEAFTSIQLEGSSTVNVVQGAQQQVEVSGFQNLVPIFETYAQNGTLVLKFRSDFYNIGNNNITVNISVPNLSAVAINGSGNLLVKNFQGTNFSAEINGSGDIYAENCKYNSGYLRVNGSGYISASALLVNEAEARISGSGKIDITAWNKLHATVAGSGEINYTGHPQSVTSEISGSGKINRR